MREFQVVDATEGLAEVFDDFATLALSCRFTNCAHTTEPGCAVQAAMNTGALTPERLERWRKLTAEDLANTTALARRRKRT
jgi:ribosome biogenesis GTPase